MARTAGDRSQAAAGAREGGCTDTDFDVAEGRDTREVDGVAPAHGAVHPLQAGRVGRAHGLDGSFYVTGAIPRLLAAGTSVAVGDRQTKVIRRAGADARPIVRVQGIEDRDAAEAVRGLVLTVAAEDAPALGEGEWWAGDLEGCEVYDGDTRVGVVRRLLELPSCEALEVGREGGGEPLLVPMVRDAIRYVDVDRRRIDVDMSFLEGA